MPCLIGIRNALELNRPARTLKEAEMMMSSTQKTAEVAFPAHFPARPYVSGWCVGIHDGNRSTVWL